MFSEGNKSESNTMKYLLSTVLFALLGNVLQAQYVGLNPRETKKLKQLIASDSSVRKLYRAFEIQADAALAQDPNPIDTIISEGHLATDPRKIITQKSLADMNKIYALAIVSRISGKSAYTKKCIDYVRAWAMINHGVGNPINDTKLDGLLEGYDMVKDKATPADKIIIEKWLRQVADAEIGHPRFRSAAKSASNNWNSHRIKVVGNIAYLLNDKNYRLFTDTSLQKQIANNLNADGSGMDFEERDALHYHIYTLEPLIAIAATIVRATGFDYYFYKSATGSSINKSVAFLVPFATGEQVHHEFVNSKVLFDRQRAENKEPGYAIGADWKKENALGVLSQAAYFEPSLSGIVKKIYATNNTYPNWRSVINAVADEHFNSTR
jgi:hypothetical protein